MKKSILAIAAVLLIASAASVSAQRLAKDEQELFDNFVWNWIASEKAVDENLMNSSFTALIATRKTLTDAKVIAFFDQFILNWTSSDRAFSDSAITTSFNTLNGGRTRLRDAVKQATFEKFVINWVGGGGDIGRGGGRRNRGLGDEQQLFKSFNELIQSRDKLPAVEQPVFDNFVIAWVNGGRTVDSANMIKNYSTLTAMRSRYKGDQQTFFDQFLVQWVSSTRAIDEAAMTKAFDALWRQRSTRR